MCAAGTSRGIKQQRACTAEPAGDWPAITAIELTLRREDMDSAESGDDSWIVSGRAAYVQILLGDRDMVKEGEREGWIS